MENQGTTFKDFVKYRVNKAVNAVFKDAHDWAKTSSGDITPEQQTELDDIMNRLENLVIKQTVQNIGPKN